MLSLLNALTGVMDPAPLPPGWRDDAVSMLFEFLEVAGLAQTLDALEKETGYVGSDCSRLFFSSLPATLDPNHDAS